MGLLAKVAVVVTSIIKFSVKRIAVPQFELTVPAVELTVQRTSKVLAW